ncbi:hypothetical protein NL427_27065, partial [Klebsiella pneumoniae]|nr:hypothetical protein [Klebsiella pneumoniae]
VEGEKLASELTADDTIRVSKHNTDKVEIDGSRAERKTSYKVEDFAPLTGREEDWRFTPLKRLAGLHTDALTGTAPAIQVEAPAGVTVETV